MSKPRPQPLFSAAPVVHEEIPVESQAPQNFTAKLRRFLLSDGESLFRAEQRQQEYHEQLEDQPQRRD